MKLKKWIRKVLQFILIIGILLVIGEVENLSLFIATKIIGFSLVVISGLPLIKELENDSKEI